MSITIQSPGGISQAAADARYLKLDGTGTMAAPIVFSGAPTLSGVAGGLSVGISLAGAATFQVENEDERTAVFNYGSVTGAKTFTLPDTTGTVTVS